ncbi:hypothetical protein AB0F43_21280 [Kribbella sp. NPDC023972]|uniref:hypothetical protein n=1 Tax=Kribbella sp. NPDC023972 TaxID=3154795 RepID=UPI00340D4D1A
MNAQSHAVPVPGPIGAGSDRIGVVTMYWPWVLWRIAALPYLVFLFRQFFAAVPREREDAAIIDGCG